MNNDLISRSALIQKIFPHGMPDDGNYPINAKAVMKAITETEPATDEKQMLNTVERRKHETV